MSIPTLTPPGSGADAGSLGTSPPTQEITGAGPPPPAASAPGAAPPPARPPVARRRRRWWILALAAGLAVVLAVVGWFVWSRWVPSAPGTPTASSVTATSVELRWAAPTGGPTVDAYLVQRDGAQVASVPAPTRTYVDQGLAPDTAYRYVVIAGAGSKRSDASAEFVVRTLPGAPTALKAAARTTTSVTLQWSPPDEGRVPDHYIVLRDGDSVATLDGTSTTYRDTGLVPVTTYAYSVVTVKGDLESGPSAELEVTTLAPPVSSASLTGTYSVDGKIVSAPTGDTINGAPSIGQTFTSTWSFSPTGTGTPGPVVATGEFAGHSFKVTLKPSGGTYTGTTKAHLSHCSTPAGSKDITDTVRVTLTLKAADVVSSTWAATSWTGTLKIESPYTGVGDSGWYCPSGTLTANLTGTALGTGT